MAYCLLTNYLPYSCRARIMKRISPVTSPLQIRICRSGIIYRCTRNRLSATAQPVFTRLSRKKAGRVFRSTRRTASTARPAISRTQARTSPGSPPRAEADPLTARCDLGFERQKARQPTNALAFWKILNQGLCSFQSLGCQELVTVRKFRSGCGIMIVTRPSATPAAFNFEQVGPSDTADNLLAQGFDVSWVLPKCRAFPECKSGASRMSGASLMSDVTAAHTP